MKPSNITASLIKLAIGCLLLALVVSRVDLREIAAIIPEGDPVLIAASVIAFGMSRFSEAVRLYFLVPARQASLLRVVDMVFCSTFFNNFAVAVVGDAYRAYALNRSTGRLNMSIATVLFDRLMGLTVVFVLAVTYVFWGRAPSDFPDLVSVEVSGRQWVFGAAAGFVVGTALTLFFREWVGAKLTTMARTLREYLEQVNAWDWLTAIASTIASQLWMALTMAMLIWAYGGDILYRDLLFAMLIVYIAAIVPISVGSLGVREGLLLIILPIFGTEPEVAVTTALLSRAVMYAYALLGGALLLRDRSEPGRGKSRVTPGD